MIRLLLCSGVNTHKKQYATCLIVKASNRAESQCPMIVFGNENGLGGTMSQERHNHAFLCTNACTDMHTKSTLEQTMRLRTNACSCMYTRSLKAPKVHINTWIPTFFYVPLMVPVSHSMQPQVHIFNLFKWPPWCTGASTTVRQQNVHFTQAHVLDDNTAFRTLCSRSFECIRLFFGFSALCCCCGSSATLLYT